MTGKARSRGIDLGSSAGTARKAFDPAASMRSSEKVLQLETRAEVRRLSNPDAEHPVTLVNIDLIDVRPQVRRLFDPKKLDALRLSILEDGVRDAVMLRPTENGRYDLVFGERRLRASKLANLTQIPSIIRELGDDRAREIQLQENQLHEQLSAIEQAEAGVKLLANRWGVSPEEVGSRLMTYQRNPKAHKDEIEALEPYWNRNMGVTWGTFTVTRLPLTRLPEAIKHGLLDGSFTEAQAKALARLDEQTQADLLAHLPLPEVAVLNGMTTRTPRKKTPEPRALLTPTHRRALGNLDGDRAERAAALLKELAELLN